MKEVIGVDVVKDVSSTLYPITLECNEDDKVNEIHWLMDMHDLIQPFGLFIIDLIDLIELIEFVDLLGMLEIV